MAKQSKKQSDDWPTGAVIMRLRTMSNYGDDYMCPNCKFEQGMDVFGQGRQICLKCGHTPVGGERECSPASDMNE